MPDDSFKEFVLDQLSALSELRAKAMFGAHGLYSGRTIFRDSGRGTVVLQNGCDIAGGLYGAWYGNVHLRDEGQNDDDGLSRSAAGRFGKCTGAGPWARRAIQLAEKKATSPKSLQGQESQTLDLTRGGGLMLFCCNQHVTFMKIQLCHPLSAVCVQLIVGPACLLQATPFNELHEPAPADQRRASRPASAPRRPWPMTSNSSMFCWPNTRAKRSTTSSQILFMKGNAVSAKCSTMRIKAMTISQAGPDGLPRHQVGRNKVDQVIAYNERRRRPKRSNARWSSAPKFP